MITTKGDHVYMDEELHRIRIGCGPDTVKMTIENALDWQAVIYFRRDDPDLHELAETLLSYCEVLKDGKSQY